MPAFLSLILGLGLLYAGAEALVRGSAALALRFGLTPLVIGLTIVAFGTSSPELIVSLRAAVQSSPGLALGNIIGSNICNIALILGLSALIRPITIHRQLLRLDIPIMVGSSLLLWFFIRDQELERWEGVVLFAALIGYLSYSIVKARQNRALVEEIMKDEPAPKPRPLPIVFLLIAGGLVLLVTGARIFVDGAIVLAETLGVSKAVIGLTIVALGTSLPELATSVVASIKKEGDISAGNVVGSNIFNIFCILGLTALIHPLESNAISQVDILTMIGLGVLCIPFLLSGFRLSRLEGAAFLAIYALYTGYLFR